MTGATVKKEGETIVIRLPLADAHSFRVALSPCPCRATKSTATAGIRDRMSDAIAKAMSRKEQPHGS